MNKASRVRTFERTLKMADMTDVQSIASFVAQYSKLKRSLSDYYEMVPDMLAKIERLNSAEMDPKAKQILQGLHNTLSSFSNEGV